MLTGGDTVTATVVRPPGKGRFGDPLPGPGTEFTIPGCLFAPGPSTENHDAANMVDADGQLFCPSGSDIRPADKVRVRGDLYEVDGRPQEWGSTWGMVVPLRRVTG